MKAIDDIFLRPLIATDPTNSLMMAIEKNTKRIVILNKRQLDQGKDADGNSLGRYARFEYKGRFQPIDLKLKGDFRDKFSLQTDRKQTEIFSQDWKEDILKARFGNIMGVPEFLIPSMAKIVKADFINFFKQAHFR